MQTRRHILLAGASLMALPPAATAAGADWAQAEPASQGLRAAAVAEALQTGEAVPGLRALLAARHGALVAERYYAGATAETLQPINSATKSLCGMLVGLALRDGRIQGLDQTVAQLLPQEAADWPGSPAAGVTLRQILTGRTGLVFDWMRARELAAANPLLPFVFKEPAVPAPPPGWTYNDAMVALLSPIVQRAQGRDLAELATQQVFAPLGIERFDWQRDREGRPRAPGGLALRPRDLLKLAALMADAGRWRGTQVLPEAWVRESLQPEGPATWRAGAVADVGYGRLWFTGQLHGQRVAWAWGYGGQFALLVPALGLVVATAATSPPPAALRAQTDAVMACVARVVEAAL